MKRYVSKVLLLCILGCVLASGTALAANIQCEAGSSSQDFPSCKGTTSGDRINGSSGYDFISGRAGGDSIDGRDSGDIILGGTGADIIDGGKGNDALLAAQVNELRFDRFEYVDDSGDILRGGPGRDQLVGGFGQGGIDYVYAGEGQDIVFVSQRVFGAFGPDVTTSVTKEVVKCGPGLDLVEFDRGLDIVDRATCEFLIPIKPNGEPVNGGFLEEERSKSDLLDLIRRVAE